MKKSKITIMVLILILMLCSCSIKNEAGLSESSTETTIASGVSKTYKQDFDDIDGDGQEEYAVINENDDFSGSLDFYFNGEKIYSLSNEIRISCDDPEYIDLDHDGSNEIYLHILPEVNSMPGENFVVLKQSSSGNWEELPRVGEWKFGCTSFPIKTVYDSSSDTVEISCDGYDETHVCDLISHYNEEKYSAYKEEYLTAKSESSEEIGTVQSWGIQYVSVGMDPSGVTCLIAGQRVSGVESRTDTICELKIYFDYIGGDVNIRYINYVSGISYSTESETLSDYGECIYEKITLSGSYAGISKINEDLGGYYSDFCAGLDGEEGYNTYAKEAEESGRDMSNFCYNWKIANVWCNNSYISITFNSEWYAGGAHGSYCTYGATYNLETGEKVLLSGIPVSNNNENISSVLTEYLISYFADKESSSGSDTEEDERALSTAKSIVNENIDDISYFIDDSGLNLYFNQYEIQSYAYGATQVTVPLSEFNFD